MISIKILRAFNRELLVLLRDKVVIQFDILLRFNFNLLFKQSCSYTFSSQDACSSIRLFLMNLFLTFIRILVIVKFVTLTIVVIVGKYLLRLIIIKIQTLDFRFDIGTCLDLLIITIYIYVKIMLVKLSLVISRIIQFQL